MTNMEAIEKAADVLIGCGLAADFTPESCKYIEEVAGIRANPDLMALVGAVCARKLALYERAEPFQDEILAMATQGHEETDLAVWATAYDAWLLARMTLLGNARNFDASQVEYRCEPRDGILHVVVSCPSEPDGYIEALYGHPGFGLPMLGDEDDETVPGFTE